MNLMPNTTQEWGTPRISFSTAQNLLITRNNYKNKKGHNIYFFSSFFSLRYLEFPHSKPNHSADGARPQGHGHNIYMTTINL